MMYVVYTIDRIHHLLNKFKNGFLRILVLAFFSELYYYYFIRYSYRLCFPVILQFYLKLREHNYKLLKR